MLISQGDLADYTITIYDMIFRSFSTLHVHVAVYFSLSLPLVTGD